MDFPFYAADRYQTNKEDDLFEGLEALDDQLAEDEAWALSFFQGNHGVDG